MSKPMTAEVLIADDSDFMRNLLREILEESHEVVDEAENGVEAVELYGTHNPDLVMMDIVMPIRDGIEATAKITDADPGATVIMVTSVGQEERMKQAIKAGADGYITKPFQKPSVLDAIDDVMPATA
jgi:two-component system chemotaxis response regulator CheY